jgi:hypothetical protein
MRRAAGGHDEVQAGAGAGALDALDAGLGEAGGVEGVPPVPADLGVEVRAAHVAPDVGEQVEPLGGSWDAAAELAQGGADGALRDGARPSVRARREPAAPSGAVVGAV